VALPHTRTSGSARMAVLYITIGAIVDVWTTIWYIWMNRHGTQSDGPYFWCYGFFFTGLTLMIIGLAVGRIGRSARHAEAPVDTTSSNAAVQAQEPVARAGAFPGGAAPAAAPPSNGQPSAPGGAVAPGAVAQPANVPTAYQPR
jgi:hypothetical protein